MSERRKLPDERQAFTHRFAINTKDGAHDGYLTVGLYEDGKPGELFIKMSRMQGGDYSGVIDGLAIAVSIALQHGATIDELCSKFIATRFEPAGYTDNKDIPRTTSPLDYIFRYLKARFAPPDLPGIVAPVPRDP